MEYHVYRLLKSSCFELSKDGNTVFFELKCCSKDYICWLLESPCFELFRGAKYGLFWSQKVDGKMIFTDYWKVLVLNFSEMGNTIFFWAKKLMERWYLLITEKFLFWTFRRWKMRSFLSKKVDVKMIFTWSLWAFYDIPGPGKCTFSCSEIKFDFHIFFIIIIWVISFWSNEISYHGP